MVHISDCKDRTELDVYSRLALYHEFLSRSQENKLPSGTIGIVANIFNVSDSTVKRIWRRGLEGATSEEQVRSVRKNHRNKCRRKGRDQNDIRIAIQNVPQMKRSTIRKTSAASSIPKYTLHDAIERGILKRQSSRMKPILSEKHKKDRLKWCLSSMDSRSLIFSSMHNIVHIDEKWFYMTIAV